MNCTEAGDGPLEPIDTLYFLSTIFIWVSVLPQLVLVIQLRESKDVSLIMVLFTIISSILWILYFLFEYDGHYLVLTLTSVTLFTRIVLALVVAYFKLKNNQPLWV